MKKLKIIHLFDTIIIFNIIMFVGAGIQAKRNGLPYFLPMVTIGIFNLLYLVFSVQVRIKFNSAIENKMKIEVQAEESFSFDKQSIFRQAKQEILETRIKTELESKYDNIRVISNAYIPRSDGIDTEIDIIAIHQTGIYVIESKNFNGRISGSWKDEQLKITYPGGKVYDLPNPINQNSAHFRALKNLLGYKNDIFRNIVVFGDNCYYTINKDLPYFASICHVEGLIHSMNPLSKRFDIRLSQEKTEDIYNNLLKYTMKSSERISAHINHVQNINPNI